MDKIPLAIVGCGGMGHRHLYGLAELNDSGLSPFELVAACDPVRANAESLAADAEDRLGTRPAVVPYSQEVFAEGHVVMLEPGIYLPGVTGVRLEDAFLVTSDGAEQLSHHDKSLP